MFKYSRNRNCKSMMEDTDDSTRRKAAAATYSKWRLDTSEVSEM